jgi:ABC-type lipoprotein export system ATPase subunit
MRIIRFLLFFYIKICIIITHDLEMASIADTSINLSD